jgi:UDP-N-acetylglucosamine diphosphorylase/glucosamine-1-phosphate N-acetyltransferase
MKAIVLNELPGNFLYPFTLTRSVLDIRIGITTIREKWAFLTNNSFDIHINNEQGIPANIIPSEELLQSAQKNNPDFLHAQKIEYPWQIFQLTDMAMRSDFILLTKNKKSHPVSNTNRLISSENIFIEEGCKIEQSILNGSTGPIYISKNAEIMEGCMIRGPFYLGEESIVKMGTRIYGATSVGKKCVIGGEIKNAVFFDYSNKAHDGYIGDSVIGSWCNLGAGSSNSNIKNTASEVKVWHEMSKQFIDAGIKCGLLMGDYSRSAINTSFNTGTVVGCGSNVFGDGLTPKHIPSFSWGFDNSVKYNFGKALNDIANWKKLKNEELTDIEIQTLKHIFENS